MSSVSAPLDSSAPHKAKLAFVLGALLVVIGFTVYRNSYAGAFVYDDWLCLLQPGRAINSWIPGPGEEWTTGARRWFTHFTFVANYKLHGYQVWGYHLVNNVIHITAALLLFGLVRRTLLLSATRERYAHSAPWLAFGISGRHVLFADALRLAARLRQQIWLVLVLARCRRGVARRGFKGDDVPRAPGGAGL